MTEETGEVFYSVQGPVSCFTTLQVHIHVIRGRERLVVSSRDTHTLGNFTSANAEGDRYIMNERQGKRGGVL
jgi:hypothetical protein